MSALSRAYSQNSRAILAGTPPSRSPYWLRHIFIYIDAANSLPSSPVSVMFRHIVILAPLDMLGAISLCH